MKGWSYISCNSDCNHWIRSQYASYEGCVRRHHWKILLAGIAFLGLCCLGFKSMDFERDIVKLWIYNSSKLHNETSYVSRHSSDHLDKGSTETVLQVSKDNILSSQFLLEHAQLLELITKLKVVYDGRVFMLHDLCRQIELPRMHYLDYTTRTDITYLMPCQIVTPLNCFWEGSKLLNRDYHMSTSRTDNYQAIKIDWRTFDFEVFLRSFKGTTYGDFFIALFNDTGIGRGYITKPCLDVTDPLCPQKKKKRLDIDGILKNGCYEIAENLYRYQKSVMVGENNHALQSLIFLRSAADVFQTMRSNELDWSEEKVQHVMDLWQSKLRQTVIRYNRQRPYLESIMYRSVQTQSKRLDKSSFYVFTNNSLATAFDEISNDKTLTTKYLVATGLVSLFLAIIFLSSDNPIRSHCWLSMAGTLLVLGTIVAGLGLSAAIGIKFSVLTAQVIPFVMLGFGIDDLLILTSCYSNYINDYLGGDITVHPVRQTLSDCVTVILLSSMIKISVIGGAVFVPVPLMRFFCGQVLLIIILQTGAAIFIYPCLLHLDSIRQRNNRIDILCCLLRSTPENQSSDDLSLPRYKPQSATLPQLSTSQIIFSTEFTTSPHDLTPDNIRQYVEINPTTSVLPHHTKSSIRTNNPSNLVDSPNHRHKYGWKLRLRVSRTFLHIITLLPTHIIIILVTIAIVVLGLHSTIYINLGLNRDSIFVIGSNEYNYVKYESTEFRMNNFDVLTKDLDYVNHQDLLLQLNDEISSVTNVQMFGNGKFWLSRFILWLENLQQDLDRDMRMGLIFTNGTWLSNASGNALLAMTLLVQDNDAINYRKLNTRLIQRQQGDQATFYLYLNAWRSLSVDYDTMPCLLYPRMSPLNMDNFTPNRERPEPSLIRMSGHNLFVNNPIQFVICKYYHRGLHDKEELSLIKTIRTITGRFSDKGVPTIPLGNVFSLSEQFECLQYQIMVALIISTALVFLVVFLLLNHILVSVIICILLTTNMLSPFIFLSAYQLPLNATSGVVALLSGGLGIRISLFVIVSYSEWQFFQCREDPSHHIIDAHPYCHLASGQQLQSRIEGTLRRSPCASVVVGTLLSCAFISMANVTYIWEHFLLLPLVAIVHSLFNCYCLGPVLCFYLLPASAILSPITARATDKSTSRLRSQCRKHPKATHPHPPLYQGPPVPDNLSTIPEESISLTSTSKSHASQDNHSYSHSQSQEQPKYVEQNIESSLTLHCPHISSASNIPELALKTSFTYRKPLTDK